MNHIYTSVNDPNHNFKNKGVDSGLKCSGYIKHLLQKS